MKSKKDQSYIVRKELTLELVKLLANFKSKEEPTYKLTKEDKINVFSAYITNKTG